ncbi:phosphodiesterase [Sulfurovum sp.]|uniref:phosphodiesterase n=1 Tax=Sulfurovum sp. TaxID=1969726 RepID=UPI0025F5E371|nr:phosphodiesterase [Sulfurovum sp.]
MRIIHISDTHILGNLRTNLFGINPIQSLKKALKSINKNYKDADFIVIAGDLVDVASPEAYEIFHSAVKKSNIPVYPILGNHDNREMFQKFYPELFNEGFVQYDFVLDNRAFVFLDTLDETKESGILCDVRLAWLNSKLQEHKERDTYLFMHHHPVACGLHRFDVDADFKTSKEFWGLLSGYNNVKHITFGHIHRDMFAVKDNISMHSSKSTTFQVALKMSENSEYLTNQEKPVYMVMDIYKDTLRLHEHDYLDEKKYYECENRWKNRE